MAGASADPARCRGAFERAPFAARTLLPSFALVRLAAAAAAAAMSIKPGVKTEKAAAAEARSAVVVTAELPPSLRSTYADVFKLVDDKQYKRAIKSAPIVI